MTNISVQASILGHHVEVLADGSKYFSFKFDNNQKFKIHRFDQLKFLRKKIKSNFASNIVKENGFDKVFFDSWKSLESFDKDIQIKKICLIHGNEILNLKKTDKILSTLKKVDGIVFNSLHTQKLFFKNIKKLHKKKYKIIYPAFIKSIEPLNPKKKYDLCTVARLEYRKGHHLVLESISLLKNNHNLVLKYAILGNGPELSRLKDLVMKFNLLKQVSFIDENVKSSLIYDQSKIHIMPAITTPDSVEGFGISNVEAAAFGLPCIVSDSGGTPESINKNGKIVKENNLEDLTKGIIDVMNNLVKLGERSHQFAKKFQNSKKIREYLDSF